MKIICNRTLVENILIPFLSVHSIISPCGLFIAFEAGLARYFIVAPCIMQTLLILAVVVAGVSCSKPEVDWISPSAGDAQQPGGTVIAKWKADKTLVSPSFKLCLGSSQSSVNRRGTSASNGNCGEKVYPTVQQDNGVYSISLSIPDTTSNVEACYLLMQDDFGNQFRSPSFSVSSSTQSAASEDPSSVSQPAASQEPESVSPPTPGAQAPVSVSKTPDAPAVTVTAVNIPDTIPDANPSPDSVYATRRSPPTAAYAVPLSIVGAILLVAGGLCIRNNKKIEEERARDVEKLDLERKRSLISIVSLGKKSTYSRQSDIEHALHVLSKHDLTYSPQRDTPVPLFMPADCPSRREREPRRATRDPYALSRADTYIQYQRHRSRAGSTYSLAYSEKSNHNMPMPVPSPSYYEPSITVCASSRAPSVRYKSRPPSRATVESHHYASSPTARYPESHVSSRPESRVSRATTSSRPCLPPINTGAPLYAHREQHGEGVTDSVLDDYLLSSPHGPPPPSCLMPAPQRLHVRNTCSDAPARDEEGMVDVDLYDAVANNLRKGYASGY
ncbi:hypothetical protein D9758_012870 [Tetrapyrgos nigripes]|uniref:Uncharacterized protein n=1 Tax=Tetrapyrgos nigripes TaxID=182062 RepID=A0A8H5FJ32_9AGAR|nr:hypothetical protein D9758_012870 [Tetrapyrgos nigripes]